MKSNFKKILVIPNYEDNQIQIQKKYLSILPNGFNVIFYNWTQFYQLNEPITFKTYFEDIANFLNTNSDNNTIIIAESLSAAIVNSIKFDFKIKILISPIFSKSFVNPYTTNIPSYKPNEKNYILKIQKEYYNSQINFLNWDQYLSNKYKFYIEHYNLFDTIISQFSIYENLKIIHKNECKSLNNTIVLTGIYDKQSIFKKIWKYSQKYNFKLIPFKYSSQHLIDEEREYFKKIIKQIII